MNFIKIKVIIKRNSLRGISYIAIPAVSHQNIHLSTLSSQCNDKRKQIIK